MYSTNDRKSKNVELRTFALYKKLKEAKLDVSYNVAEYNEEIFDAEDNPIRTLKILQDGAEFYLAYLIKNQDNETGFYLRRQTTQKYDDYLDATIEGAKNAFLSLL